MDCRFFFFFFSFCNGSRHAGTAAAASPGRLRPHRCVCNFILFFHFILIACGGVGDFIFESEKPSHLLTLALWKVLAAARHACLTELQRVPPQNARVSLQCAVDVFATSTNVCELSKKIQNLSMLRGFSIRLQEWLVEIVIEISGHSGLWFLLYFFGFHTVIC